MPNLNWTVPCRRAVVTGRTDYISILDEWETSLYHHRETICRWYNIDGGEYMEEGKYFDALVKLMEWKVFFCLAGENAALLEGEVTIDFQDLPDFYVRLWKGPLRIVMEEASRDTTSTRTIQLPPLQLNENKEVINRDAQFLAGDVIEFPLHKFLVICELSQYGNLAFNPNGSFFLGTSLKEGDNSPPTSVTIHENMLGNRFQLLLNAALGSFASLDHVFTGRFQADELNAADGNDHVYSRGLVYGATLLAPHVESEGNHWRIFTNHWGYAPRAGLTYNEEAPVPANLPTPDTIRNYPPNLPFTSGWSCSPCTLYLSYFIFNAYDYGDESVLTEFEDTGSILRQCYNRFTASQAVENFGLNIPNQAVRNMSDVFGDMNVIAFGIPRRVPTDGSSPPHDGGHEIAIVKIYNHDLLMREEQLPVAGFLAAYHPLNGSSYFQNSELIDEGQLYIFETAGSLSTKSGGGQWCGASPFHWEIIPNNNMHVLWGRANHDPRRQTRLRISMNSIPLAPNPPTRHIKEMYILQNPNPLPGNFDTPAALKPLVIYHPVTRNNVWTANADPIFENVDQIYAERAVPMPTMKEAEGKFPRASVVQQISQHEHT